MCSGSKCRSKHTLSFSSLYVTLRVSVSPTLYPLLYACISPCISYSVPLTPCLCASLCASLTPCLTLCPIHSRSLHISPSHARSQVNTRMEVAAGAVAVIQIRRSITLWRDASASLAEHSKHTKRRCSNRAGCSHCAALIVLHSLRCSHCAALRCTALHTALLSLRCSHRAALTALLSLRCSHCAGCVLSLRCSHCAGCVLSLIVPCSQQVVQLTHLKAVCKLWLRVSRLKSQQRRYCALTVH